MHRSEANRNQITELLAYLLGEDVLKALETFEISDVWANSDGIVRYKSGGKRKKLGPVLTPSQMQQIISYVADLNWRVASDVSAIVEAKLPWGGRFIGIMPPHIYNGATFCIRNHLRQTFPLESYLETGRCDKQIMKAIELAMIERANIAIIGVTESGKTSFLDTLTSHETVRDERVLVIEEVNELRLEYVEDKEFLGIDPRNLMAIANIGERYRALSQEINSLVRGTLRMDPDRIIIGESRGGELHELVKAAYTGHGGALTTLHADHPRDALHRMELMLAEVVSDVRPFRFMLCNVIHRIVLMRRDPRGGGQIIGVYKPLGWDETKNSYVITTLAGEFLRD
jgi:type IV secretion system protein TrbB